MTQVFGADRAYPPDSVLLQRAASLGVEWFGAYIGGPYTGGLWSPEQVNGIGHLGYKFLPIYVGQQAKDPPNIKTEGVFTMEQGQHDAEDAIHIMREYGWPQHQNIPIVLDVEFWTYESHPEPTRQYIRTWLNTVRNAGYYPGIYGGAQTCHDMAQVGYLDGPTFVWIASWLKNWNPSQLDLMNIPGMPSRYFGRSQRLWQYAALGDYDLNLANEEFQFAEYPAAYVTPEPEPPAGITVSVEDFAKLRELLDNVWNGNYQDEGAINEIQAAKQRRVSELYQHIRSFHAAF